MAKNFMSSILDELMGRDRNALPTEQPKKINWDDPEMCPHYLVCFCPHDLFVNTKADLGSCSRVHDEQMRKKYQDEASSNSRYAYESEFIRFGEKMISDIEAKIKRGKQRIALANGPEGAGGNYAPIGSKNADKINLLNERVNKLLEEAEEAGCEGDVEKAQGLMKLCDQLKEEREQLKSTEVSHPWNPDKAMQVCEVCGSYLIIGEAQHRLDDHIMGKQHMGFALLRKNLEDVKKAREARGKEDREKREKEREMRRAREQEHHSKDRVRGSGDSRDRDYDRRSRNDKVFRMGSRSSESSREPSRGEKDKSRRHDGERDRRSEKKKKRSRSRSRERKDRHRHKDKKRRRSEKHKDSDSGPEDDSTKRERTERDANGKSQESSEPFGDDGSQERGDVRNNSFSTNSRDSQ